MTEQPKKQTMTKAQILKVYQLRWSGIHPTLISEQMNVPISRVRHCVAQLTKVLANQKPAKEFPTLPRNRIRLYDIAVEVVNETTLAAPKTK